VRTSLFDPSALERESIDRALHIARPYFRGRVLDVGCGERPYAALAQECGCRYTGVDLSASHMPPPDVCADSCALPFRDKSFDTVLSTQVLEHVRDPFATLREAARILREGGNLILTAPQVWPLHEEPHDFYRYTRYGLEHLLEVAGLTPVTITERGGGILALTQLFALLMYDGFHRHTITRVPAKLIIAPVLWLGRRLDRLLPMPKLTLGYLVVARK
jgi:SAM-dependent methyltransferase